VIERQKDIGYSSRTRVNTNALAANANLQQAVADLIKKLPARLRSDPAVATLQEHLTHQAVDIVHLINRDKPYELDSKDYEFSRAMVKEHWEAGALCRFVWNATALSDRRGGTERVNRQVLQA